jgi:hypothetical protein
VTVTVSRARGFSMLLLNATSAYCAGAADGLLTAMSAPEPASYVVTAGPPAASAVVTRTRLRRTEPPGAAPPAPRVRTVADPPPASVNV